MNECLTIVAPRYRFYSVQGLLLDCKAVVLNQEELDLAIFGGEPLHFRFNCVDLEGIRLGIKKLTEEFGDEFNLIEAGQ